MPGAPTIVFDGLCKFCNGWANFVIKRDVAKRFRFATAQSVAGAALMAAHGLSATDLSTVLFVHDGKGHVKSSAGIRILMALGGMWPLAGALLIVPRVIRDGLYVLIARNRFRIAGRYDACPMPPPDRRDQFLG